MKYTVVDENGEEVSLRFEGAFVWLSIPNDNENEFMFTIEEFKQFRRAVGYVWQEIEAADK